jgi:hypothetical protein
MEIRRPESPAMVKILATATRKGTLALLVKLRAGSYVDKNGKIKLSW